MRQSGRSRSTRGQARLVIGSSEQLPSANVFSVGEANFVQAM